MTAWKSDKRVNKVYVQNNHRHSMVSWCCWPFVSLPASQRLWHSELGSFTEEEMAQRQLGARPGRAEHVWVHPRSAPWGASHCAQSPLPGHSPASEARSHWSMATMGAADTQQVASRKQISQEINPNRNRVHLPRSLGGWMGVSSLGSDNYAVTI